MRNRFFSRLTLSIRFNLVFLLSAVLAISGCTSTRVKTAELEQSTAIGKNKTVVLLSSDIALSEILAGGVEEPRVEWSKAAEGHILQGLRAELTRRQVRFVEQIEAHEDQSTSAAGNADSAEAAETAPAEPAPTQMKQAGAEQTRSAVLDAETARAEQVRRLASVVGTSVLFHALLDQSGLPTKRGKLEWSIGPGAQLLKRRYQSDFAMLTYVRDSYASSGTKALKVLGLATALAFGVGANVSTGQRLGYTMLIDLDSGKVIWVNFLQSETGDLRQAEGAVKVLATLLKGLPL